jgi:hypothetical protein
LESSSHITRVPQSFHLAFRQLQPEEHSFAFPQQAQKHMNRFDFDFAQITAFPSSVKDD